MKRVVPEVERPRIQPARFVRFGPVAEALTGITDKAMHQKVNAGVWLEGHEWRKGPDARRYLDVFGYEAWVKGEPRITADDLRVIGERLARMLKGMDERGISDTWAGKELRDLLALITEHVGVIVVDAEG